MLIKVKTLTGKEVCSYVSKSASTLVYYLLYCVI